MVLGAVPDPRTALIWCFVLTGPVFPLGYAITRLFGGNLFAKSRMLTPPAMQLAALQLFFWPIVILVFLVATPWTPFTLAVLFGSHSLPYGWIYRSRGHPFLAVSLAVVLGVGALITGRPMFHEVPVLDAGCYVVALAIIWIEVRPGQEKGA